MILYFLRHASAGESLVNPKKRREARLDKEGIEQCGYVGRALAAHRCSGGRDRFQPAETRHPDGFAGGQRNGLRRQAADRCGLRPGHLCGLPPLLEKYARQESIMVVGHNPNLSQFLGTVISESGCEASVELKKGAVARVDMRRSSGTLQWCLTPKILRTLYDTAVESSRPNTSRKISAIFLDRPQFQIHSHAAAGNQRQAHLGGAMADAHFLHGAAAAQVQGARQAQQHNRFLHPGRSAGSRAFMGGSSKVGRDFPR
jgi:phosphohistidine phosphatase